MARCEQLERAGGFIVAIAAHLRETDCVERDRRGRRLAIALGGAPEVCHGLIVVARLNRGFAHAIERLCREVSGRALCEYLLQHARRTLVIAYIVEVITERDLCLKREGMCGIQPPKLVEITDGLVLRANLKRDFALIKQCCGCQHVVRVPLAKALKCVRGLFEESVGAECQAVGKGGSRRNDLGLRRTCGRMPCRHHAGEEKQGKYLGKWAQESAPVSHIREEKKASGLH